MLTKKQTEFLKVVERFIKEQGFSPTLRELCELTGLRATSTIKGYIDRLIEKGYIEKQKDCPRTIRVVKTGN